jgi:hypothetical protein
MRSSTPMPGNPWPHDMVITIQDDSTTLLDLLWIRGAWGLSPVGDDLPPLLVPTPSPETPSSDTPIGAWSDAWPDIWRACLTHVGLERDPQAFERLHTSTLEPQERSALLTDLFGPSWQDRFGDGAFTERHGDWTTARFEERTTPSRLEESPERQCLDELVPAWRAGLTTIVTIPCRGAATRRVGAHALLVTEQTRADPGTYAEALRSFARPTP